MSTRRQAREWALQMIFELDQNPEPETPIELRFAAFWKSELRLRAPDEPPEGPEPAIRAFAESLVRGVESHLGAVDRRIQERCPNWKVARLGAVERAVLRLGVYELVFAPETTPPAVAINEAVDLAKFFGSLQAGSFVNGVLDAVARREREGRERARAKPGRWSPRDDAPPPRP